MTKLIATDMDGTFLRGDMTYDKLQFRNIHERMMAAEIKFVVASGNQYYQLQSFFRIILILYIWQKTVLIFVL